MDKGTKKTNASASKVLTLDQISSGGVAFRRTESGQEVALVLAKPKLRWQLPKGIVDPGESPEVTAVREVREEARWVSIDEAIEMLAFKNEREVVGKAREIIAARGNEENEETV